jgi:hypothetical protein
MVFWIADHTKAKKGQETDELLIIYLFILIMQEIYSKQIKLICSTGGTKKQLQELVIFLKD